MNAVTIVGVVSAFGLVFLWLLVLCAEKGERPFRRMRQGFRRLPAWEKMLLSIFVGVWIAFASVKDGTNGVNQVEGNTNTVTQIEGNTNDWTNVEGTNIVGQADGERTNGMGWVSGLLMTGLLGMPNLTSGAPQSITEEDVARMWRSVVTTDASALVEPTANAVTNLDWRDYGGMSDSLRIKPEGWYFPFGDKTTAGLTVFENGDFRPNVKTHFFPQPFDASLSLLPRWKWGLLPNGGESVFWHEHTLSNSLVLTWHNALYNRDANCPTNFQAELFADGRFDYRYPDRTVQYVPVFPFDWDGDGLENSVDPEPMVAGLDAHGTNAEWYNRVCGNVFVATQGADGLELAPRTGDVNTNAYYFVDVVAQQGPVLINFTADGSSSLGNPVVVAQEGENNRVPLLIGAKYIISSSSALSITAPAEVEVSRLGDEDRYSVEWPVPISVSSNGDGVVTPSVPEELQLRLGGSFSWTGGCCVRHVGDAMQFCCDGCGCGGCTAYVNYLYEGYLLATQGPSCGCSSEHEGCPHVETDAGGGVSLGFDRKAVIFEDAYDNSPSNHVARRSTQTILTLRANGGINGGTLVVTTRNLSRLNLVHGSRPTGTRTLAPYEAYEVVSTNEGLRASTNLRDVEVEATFTENVTGERMSVHDALTSVRLELHEVYEAPENKTCKNRHVYGVGEKVRFLVRPQSPEIKFSTVKLDVFDSIYEYELFDGELTMVDGSTDRSYVCPISANYLPSIKVSVAGVDYLPTIRLVEPQSVITPGASWGENHVDLFYQGNRRCWEPGMVGEACLVTTNYIGPMDVSFRGIAVSEVPCEELDVVTGSFACDPATSPSHTRREGAGTAKCIQDGNFWFVDGARSARPEPQWSPNSTLSWYIPIGWHRRQLNSTNDFPVARADVESSGNTGSRDLLVGGRIDAYKQIRHIDENGVFRTDKFGHWISRSPACHVVLDGETLQWTHHSSY